MVLKHDVRLEELILIAGELNIFGDVFSLVFHIPTFKKGFHDCWKFLTKVDDITTANFVYKAKFTLLTGPGSLAYHKTLHNLYILYKVNQRKQGRNTPAAR